MYCISCLISFIALCYAWPTLRGRWTCWTLGHCFYITTCYYSDLSVTCILLTHVYHLTSSVLLLDQLACHHLVRPDCYVMIDPAHSTFIVMFYCLLDITTLSCYPLNQAWYTWLYDYLNCGNPALFYGTKCHTVQWWGPPLESIPSEQSATWNKVPHRPMVGATSWICGGHLLNLQGYSFYSRYSRNSDNTDKP